jgi:hypothetical protein
MADVTETPTPPPAETDLVAASRQVLERRDEPLTLSKIRSALPAAMRTVDLNVLEQALERQVAANVLYQYPKYRSPQNRYWDRPMRTHLLALIQVALREEPLGPSQLRRKLPDYAKHQIDALLEEELAQGRLFRHPAQNSRSGERLGLQRPDPKEYLRAELIAVFSRLEQLGFTQAALRAGAQELLHEDEWGTTPAQPTATSNESYRTGEERPTAPTETGTHEPTLVGAAGGQPS